MRTAFNTKKIEMCTKKNELNFINETLSKIDEIKERKKRIKGNIDVIDIEIEDIKVKQEDDYTSNMLQLY